MDRTKMRRVDYTTSTTCYLQSQNSVDHHQAALIQSEPGEAHLDQLLAKRVFTDEGYSEVLAKRVFTDEGYSEVLAKNTRYDQMRELCIGPLKASGIKYIFFKNLEKYLLIRDLKSE